MSTLFLHQLPDARDLQEIYLRFGFDQNYYDIYKLLDIPQVLNFIGSKEYYAHKTRRFRAHDETEIRISPAFILKNP